MPVPVLETTPASAGPQERHDLVQARPEWTHHPHLNLPRLRHGAHAIIAGTAPITDRWAWRRRIRADPRRAFFYRIAVGILGGLLVIAGPLTGPLPGPGGIPLVLLGLAVWSSEFHWARRLATWFKAKLAQYRRLPRGTQAAVVAGVFALIGALWYLGLIIVGVPGWLPEVVTAWLLHLPGVA